MTPEAPAHPKVLLIDDDATLTAMLTEFLRGEGFETIAAFNGIDGALAALDPDLDAVILDVMMPDISGIETLQRIRSSSAVPVIMLTAKGAKSVSTASPLKSPPASSIFWKPCCATRKRWRQRMSCRSACWAANANPMTAASMSMSATCARSCCQPPARPSRSKRCAPWATGSR